jgi:endonuclease-3
MKNTHKSEVIQPKEIVNLLEAKYGKVYWKPRHKPIDELVLTILSQHTSDINSERAFKNLQKRFKDMDSILDAEVYDIEKAIKSAGLYRIKALRIKNILQYIYNESGSLNIDFLGDMSMNEAKRWLMKIDGIGPKTAAIVLCFSFGMPAIPVDTHVHRLSKRLGLIGKKITADAAHDLLEGLVDEIMIFPFHVYLIKHGRNICKAVRPLCNVCVLSHKCPSRIP